jgi:hypothetical protein
MSFKKNIAKLTEKKSVSSIFFLVLLVFLVGIIHTKPSIAQSITPEPDPGNTDTIVTPLEDGFHIVVGIPGTSLVRLSQSGSSLLPSRQKNTYSGRGSNALAKTPSHERVSINT